MLIKYLLVAMPLALVAILLGAGLFVPNQQNVETSKFREDRFIEFLTADAEQMNPWLAGKSTDTDVYDKIFEGLLTFDGNIQLVPKLAQSVRIGEEVVVLLDPGMDPNALREKLESGLRSHYGEDFVGVFTYDWRNFSTKDEHFGNRVAELSGSGVAPDGAHRLVLGFRPSSAEAGAKDEIATCVKTDVKQTLDRIFEQSFQRPGFVSMYRRQDAARAWYAHRYDIDMPAPPVGASEAENEAYAKRLTELAHQRDAKAPTLEVYEAAFPASRISEHPLVEVVLREGVKWHDYAQTGEMLDVEDVVRTFILGRDKRFASPRSFAKSVLQFRIHGSHRFDIVYNRLFSPALAHLAYAKILPAHHFTEKEWIRQAIEKGRGPSFEGDTAFDPMTALPAEFLDFSRAPIGTGPLKLVPLNGPNTLPYWKSGELIRLERFEEYWDEMDRAQFKYRDFYVVDPNLGLETAQIMFRSGAVDYYEIPLSQAQAITSEFRDRYYIYTIPDFAYEYIGFNLDREYFKDLRVRQALTLAVNVDEIIQYVMYGYGERISGPGYPVLDYYDHSFVPDYTFRQGPRKGKTLRESGLKFFPYDLDEAAALLAESGWIKGSDGKLLKNGRPFKFTILLGSSLSSARGKVAVLAKDSWERLGLQVDIENLEWNVFINERIDTRNFDACVLGWSGGVDFDKRVIWHSSSLPPQGLNFCGYNNEHADKLMEDILAVYDPKQQVAMANEFFSCVGNDCPYVFLFSHVKVYAMSRNFFWNRPVQDSMHKLTREPRSFLDPDLMDLKSGPTEHLVQMKRVGAAQPVLFPAFDGERTTAGGKTAGKR